MRENEKFPSKTEQDQIFQSGADHCRGVRCNDVSKRAKVKAQTVEKHAGNMIKKT